MLAHYIAILGQVMLGIYFLSAGWNHFQNATMMAGYAGSKGVPSPKLAVLGSGALLLIGGVSVITGDFLFWGILALVIFLIPVSFMMHAYWKDTDPMARANNRINFTKNMAILGALFLLWALPMLAYKL